MKNIFFSALTVFGVFFSSCVGAGEHRSKPESSLVSETENTAQAMSKFHDFKMRSISGEEIDFAGFKGKKVLIVNVASRCGYTPQYADLQKLHELHGDKVVILGVPANDFGAQEPGSNEDIASFCQKNYGVTFRMFEKVTVKGANKTPLYRWLSDKSQNGWNEQEPKWNFCKYLISETGELKEFFGSGVKPLSDEMIKAIKS